MAPKAKQRVIKPADRPIPQPFSPAPAELEDLLETFDKSVVYITHIDTHPAWFKKRIFAVPVLLNLNILALLLWRAWYILPYYAQIFLSILRYHNETTIHYATTSRNELIWKVFKRMLSFMLDFFLVRVVFPWPTSFFIEWPGNPIRWRWNTGFRDEEVYVRQSRSWGAEDLLGVAAGSTGKAGGESPFFKTRILPALDQARLKEKTGYLLMDADFDLDFYGMIAATQLIDRKTISASVLRKAVFVYVGDLTSDVKNGQWCWWDCSPLDEGSETEARSKIIEFKDKLTEMGKESLFFKWVELIQYESNAPGGFTQERQIEAGKKVKKLFEDNGVDFEKLSREIGGIDGMPGL